REHHVQHHAVAGGGGAHCHAGQRGFADRRVADAVAPEAVEQTARVAEDGELDVLAEHDDLGVALHLLEERVVDGLGVSSACHCLPPYGLCPANMRSNTSSVSAGSLACENSTASATVR